MSQRANYFKIGVFVIVAVLLAVGGLALLGLKSVLRTHDYFETYIDESVQGLDVGSPVKYRGVQLGHVKRIALLNTVYETDDRRKRQVYVELEIDPSIILGDRPDIDLEEAIMSQAINHGLRVRMASQGVTGLAYLELDFLKDCEPFEPPPWKPILHHIPSTRSTITRFTDAIDVIFKKLEHVEFDRIIKNAEELIASANRAVANANVESVIKNLDQLVLDTQDKLKKTPIEEVGHDVARLITQAEQMLSDLRVPELRTDVGQMISDLRVTNQKVQDMLAGATATLAKVDGVSKDLPALVSQTRSAIKHVDQLVIGQHEDLTAVLENVRLISEHLRGLSLNAEKYPSQLLFGVPPPAAPAKKP